MKLDSQKMISGEKRISRPRTSQSARSRIKGPIYQEEDPSNFWEVDLSFRPIDISIFGRNQGFRHNFSSYAEWEKTYGYQLSSGSGSESDDSDLDSDEKKNADNKLQEELLRTTQLVYSYKDGKGMVPKLREPRNLYALAKELGPQQAARWPADIQVLDEKVKHIRYIPPDPELFYKPTGCEKTPMVRGEENGGRLVYMYEPRSTFFVRSRVGGLRSGPQKCNIELQSEEDDTLIFESRFESGNLAKAVQVNSTDYELWLRYDLYTNKHTQWFYFRVSNTRANKTYRFTIVNFMKSDSLYNDGMKPLIYSEKNAQQKKVGWVRGGSDIKYYKNNLRYSTSKSDKSFYSLTWTVKLEHNHDTVYFAHCFPYTYTDLQDYLLDLSNDPVKNKICKQRVLCRTLAGNLVYLLSITSPTQNSEDMKHKKAVVITSRVHPGECNSSWMMKGFLDYLTGNSADAKLLRDTFIFKIVPMLNPDGVIVGNYRCSLAGRDLNRNYKTVLKDSYPSVWHTKNMIRKLLQEREIIVYCDLHGHSRKQNVFIYGCENRHNPEKRLKERVFPLMLNKNAPDKFKFESCKFKVQKSKEGTGRIVMWNMGIMNSYTMEATFCGSTMGKKKGYHFSMADFEALGYHFCDTLLDYCDPDNTKSCNILLEIEERLKREIMVKLQKAASTSMPDINDINLSDYSSEDVESSDGGSDSSVSDGPPVHLKFTASRPTKKKKKLKTKKERDRVRSLKDEPKKPAAADRPVSDPHACEKKPILTGHQQAHAKQEKYLLRFAKSDYLEALTNAYLRNGLLTQDQAAPHFRYSGNKVSPTIPFNLEGLCPHHEQTFAAQYMAQQIQNINSGADPTIDEIVRSQISHQASIPMSRQPTQRHILEVSAAQQRQQDVLTQARRHGDKSAKNSRPRAHVPETSFNNYEPLDNHKKPPPPPEEHLPPSQGDATEETTAKEEPVMEEEEEIDHRKHGHKGKHKEKGGRKSRMGMRESDDDPGPSTEGPDYLQDPHHHNGPRVKSAKGGKEMDSVVESIKELRQSLANNAMQQNHLSPTTGGYIKRLMRETGEEIEELTNEIRHDIEQEHRLAKDRDKQKAKEIKKFQSLDDYKMNENRNSNSQALSIGNKSKTVLTREPPGNSFDDKRPFNARYKSKSVTNYPISDRTHDRNQKWRDPSLMITGDTSLNYSNTYITNARKSTSETVYTIPASSANATHVNSSGASVYRNSLNLNTTSTATQTSSKMEKAFPRVELYPDTDHPIRLADANGYAMTNTKSKSAKDLRDGITNVITGKEDRKSDKYFEFEITGLTLSTNKYRSIGKQHQNRVRSAKSGRQSVEAVPTKIQLMISQDHQEEKAFGGQFLPLSRTIRAPFYRNNSKRK